MADHRTEQILSAIQALVTGLVTTGANVDRGRYYPIDAAIAHALTVAQGQAVLSSEQTNSFVDVELEVRVIAHTKQQANNLDTVLNQIAKEVYIAIMADRSLALPFVIDTHWRGTTLPELSGETEAPAARQEIIFAVKYRHSITDPSQ